MVEKMLPLSIIRSVKGYLFALLICTTSFFLATCQPNALERAKSKVKVGITREQAITILRDDAWYYQACPNLTTIDDLFFYGSRDYNHAEIVIISSDREDQNLDYQVFQLGTLEPNAWHTAYADCVDVSEFQGK